jgi:uncharacterized protein (DUF433 family)
MDWKDCKIVETIPGKVSGVPVLKGTRVPADAVVENYECGESVDEIAFNFDLDPGDIREVLAYASAQQTTAQTS